MEPKIYTRDEHGIDISRIDSHAYYILQKLHQNGFEAYIVGGGVRDLLLGQKPKDFDISTSARPEEIKKVFPNSILIGRRFRLAHIRFGKKVFEVSTFRSGNITDDSLIIHDNVWGTAEEDVMRRDFTCNGLFYDGQNETVIDYVDGLPDVKKNFLRVIGKPYVRFKQDPVRMIRMLKFIGRYGFEADPDADQALLECRSEILKSSQARILEELLRMLESGHASQFFKLMTDKGLMQILLPKLGEFLETDEGNNVFSYLKEVDQAVREPKGLSYDRAVLLSCIVYPMLEKHLNVHYLEGGHVPHLGTIHGETYSLINETFLPFFKIPRRMKGKMTSIITSQFRITPITKRRPKKVRIPRILDFDLAVSFATFRNRLEPGLTETIDRWKEALELHAPPKQQARKRPRKRRR